MKRQIGISRRDFIRLTGATTAALLSLQSAKIMNASTQTNAEIALEGGDADIWAWEHIVHGRVSDPACTNVTLTVNDTIFEVPVVNGRFSAVVPIHTGENVITASCESANLTAEPITYTGKLRDVPRSNIAIRIDGDGIHLNSRDSTLSEWSNAPIINTVWAVRASNPAALEIAEPEAAAGEALDGSERPALTVTPPTEDGEYYISLTVTDSNGSTDTSETYFTVADGIAFLSDWDTENAAWIENAVVYGVIVRNFGSEGFQSVIDRLDSLQDLGIDALWLGPIYPSPAGDYGYAVNDYFDVSSRYGDLEDFRRMVEEAHARNIRVLLDFVPNHSSDRHPYFQTALTEGAASPYWDYYDRAEDGQHTYYFDWTNLPNLNFENPDVRRWMLEAFTYWVREFGVDGFRVDVAWGIRERRPDFWMMWRDELKRLKPDVLLLAEASARDDFYFTEGFDAAYDWTSQLGHWAWELVFEDRDLLTFNLNAALTNLRNGFHDDALIFRFINNNDTGSRFISKYGPDMTRVAAALLLTLPGIPCVYTGDEYGERFSPYFDPNPLTWEDTFGLRDYYKTLIALRHNIPSLHSRVMTILEAAPRTDVYAYARHLADGSQPVLVLLNFTNDDVAAEITLPEAFAELARESLTDAITGESITTTTNGGTLQINAPAMRALILM